MLTSLAVVWLVCGVLAYGVAKNHYRQVLINLGSKYSNVVENRFRKLILGGPFTLGWTLIIYIQFYSPEFHLGTTFRMPKELCESALN